MDPAFLETSEVASLGATCEKRWELLDTLCSLHFLAQKINSTTIYWLHYYYATDVIADKYLVQHMTANPSGVSHIGAKGERVGRQKDPNGEQVRCTMRGNIDQQ
jgi:hypothetical protein